MINKPDMPDDMVCRKCVNIVDKLLFGKHLNNVDLLFLNRRQHELMLKEDTLCQEYDELLELLKEISSDTGISTWTLAELTDIIKQLGEQKNDL